MAHQLLSDLYSKRDNLQELHDSLSSQLHSFDVQFAHAPSQLEFTDSERRNTLLPGMSQQSEGLSLKEMVMHALNLIGTGAEVQRVIDYITHMFDVTPQRTSVSPTLSRLKQEGLVTLEDDLWRITLKGRNWVIMHGRS